MRSCGGHGSGLFQEGLLGNEAYERGPSHGKGCPRLQEGLGTAS